MRHSATTSRCQEDCTKATRCGLAKGGCAGLGGGSGVSDRLGESWTSGFWTSGFWTCGSCNILFMAFLVREQHQDIRNDEAPRKRAGIATVLFHPDFNRRPRNCTESADPSLF